MAWLKHSSRALSRESVLWSPPHISRYVAEWISQPLIIGRSVDNYSCQADHVVILALSYLEFRFSKEWVELNVQVLLKPGDPDPSWLRGRAGVIPAVSLLRSHLCHLNPWNFKGLLVLLMYNTWEWVDPWMGLSGWVQRRTLSRLLCTVVWKEPEMCIHLHVI